MPAPGTIDPCSLSSPVTAPTDGELESAAPGWWRYLQELFLRWTRLQHACDGKHFYGVATGTANAVVVEVGNASRLVTVGLHAGLFVKFLVGTTNTGATTLQITSNSTNVGSAVAITFLSAALNAGALVAGQVVEVVYDGTAWQLLTVFTAALQADRRPIFYDGAATTPQAVTNTETPFYTYVLAANDYQTIHIIINARAIVSVLGGFTSARVYIFINIGSTPIASAYVSAHTTGTKDLYLTGDASIKAGGTITITVQEVSGPFTATISALNVRIVGVY